MTTKPEPLVTIQDVRTELLAELSPTRADDVIARLLVRAGGTRRVRTPRVSKPCEPSPEAMARARAALKRKGVV
jgi:hypothetical protein